MRATEKLESSEIRNPIHAQTALGLLGGAIALVTPLALLAAPRSDTVAIVGGAGSDTGEVVRVVTEAGGSILDLGGRPDVVLARSDSVGFVARLYAAGARLVLDGGLASGCGRRDQAAAPPRTSPPDFGHPAR